MSRAPKTPLIPLRVDSTPPDLSSSTQSTSQLRPAPSLSMFDAGELAKKAAVKRLVHLQDPGMDSAEGELWAIRQRRTLDARMRNLPIPPPNTPMARAPAPYRQHLTPTPSHLRPHCLAKDRLKLWTPAPPAPSQGGTPTISEGECKRIKSTMLHVWEEDTQVVYGAGLLMWHCFCDENGTSEEARAPATQPLLSMFVVHLAAAYSGKTISGYVSGSGVQAWHILHGLPWALKTAEMDAMLWAANKLTPNLARKKKRCPYTLDLIQAVRDHLNLDKPLDAVVFTCLTTCFYKPLDAVVFTCLTMCFYASARLGEFTVRALSSFNPNTHVTTQHLTYNQDCNGFKVTVLHLPRTKAAGNEGKDVYWASQEGSTDPTAALTQHLRINQPSVTSHLFAYKALNTCHALTKTKFLERVAGLKLLQGHGIRIGSTLEYLLRGVPFDVMKAKGHWAGDSFQLYLRKHAVVIAPYIQATPIHENFIQYTMPPVR